MKKGDVVLIAFPFSDLSGQKVRPAIVYSTQSYNKKYQDALFILISSNTNGIHDYDLLIESSHPEFKRTGLIKESKIKTDKVVSLLQKSAKRKLGELPDDIKSRIDEKLIELFELN